MKLGAFTIIKNDAHWVGFSIMSTKDFVQEYVYFDGNSQDGTPEMLKYIRDKYDVNIKVFEDQDPADMKDDYVRVFNECLRQVKSDYVWFLHPDMICTKFQMPEAKDTLAFYTNMRSFAGEPNQSLLEFMEGRTDKWKSIMLNGLGLHYYGHYGVGNEDLYFKDVTGNEHVLFENINSYPYEIRDSGIELWHYSDVRSYDRRLGRMVTCLKNQYPGIGDDAAKEAAKNHPRVLLEPRSGFGKFELKPAPNIPDVFYRHNAEFAAVCGKRPEEFCYLPLYKREEACLS